MKGLLVLLWLAGLPLLTAEPIKITVDLERTSGIIKPLHGINKGPLAAGGTINLATFHRELGAPLTRLHDCQWPYPDVVDVHAIFRTPGADPANERNYDWALTDAYLASVHETGAEIVYRLGESIEHGPVKRFVHPPGDVEKWAQVCVGIVRHYNEGWAGGTNYHIRYWEIWNEPENRPAMWSGTDEEYLRLYQAAALAIKRQDARLQVGGPSLGYSGEFRGGQFVPSGLATNFLASCRSQAVPLDFFSWHCYTADPAELVRRAKAIRRLLDDYGFLKTESHLNEWNYLPGNSWDGFSSPASPEMRQKFYEEMAGASGAAFVATALIELQDAPVDVCNFYHAELGAFGLFNEFGVPNRAYYALRAFARVARWQNRLAVSGGEPGKVSVLASRSPDKRSAAVLLSHFKGTPAELHVKFQGKAKPAACRTWILDEAQNWHEVATDRTDSGSSTELRLNLAAPGVALIEINPP